MYLLPVPALGNNMAADRGRILLPDFNQLSRELLRPEPANHYASTSQIENVSGTVSRFGRVSTGTRVESGDSSSRLPAQNSIGQLGPWREQNHIATQHGSLHAIQTSPSSKRADSRTQLQADRGLGRLAIQEGSIASEVSLYQHPQGTGIADSVQQTSARISTEANTPAKLEQRKRAFVTRTKTGCITCRRRKKKCDEAKPFCENCKRIDVECGGYMKPAPWPITVLTHESLTAAREGTTAGACEPSSTSNPSRSLIYKRKRGAGDEESQERNSNPRSDRAGAGGRPMAIRKQNPCVPVPHLWNDETMPSEAVDPSVRSPASPRLQHSISAVNKKDAGAILHSKGALVPNMGHIEHAKTPQDKKSQDKKAQDETSNDETPESLIDIGEYVTIGPYSQLRGPSRITIGRKSQIGAYVTITTEPDNSDAGYDANNDTQIYIGDNVSVGCGCIIKAGVRIGPRTNIASGSVVVHRPSPGL